MKTQNSNLHNPLSEIRARVTSSAHPLGDYMKRVAFAFTLLAVVLTAAAIAQNTLAISVQPASILAGDSATVTLTGYNVGASGFWKISKQIGASGGGTITDEGFNGGNWNWNFHSLTTNAHGCQPVQLTYYQPGIPNQVVFTTINVCNP
jgi:hypothetical protein